MYQVAFALLFLLFSLSTTTNASVALPPEQAELVHRCHNLIQQFNDLARAQHKQICKSKLNSAEFKVDLAAHKINLKRYRDADHHLNYALDDLHFAVYIDCTLKQDIVKTKVEARNIQKEVKRLQRR